MCSATQTQTEQDLRSRANPGSILGFDDWHDIPPDVAQFLSYAGATMEAELEKSDASQVRSTGPNGVLYVHTLSNAVNNRRRHVIRSTNCL